MKIAVRGTEGQINELQNRISKEHSILAFKDTQSADFDILFDLEFDRFPQRMEDYAELENKTLVLAAVMVQLEAVFAETGAVPKSKVIGINALPTFINRDLAEVCYGNADENTALFRNLGWDCRTVEGRVGMVTPRIICMIINEAYYTVQEGTAGKEDIDLGMKLGTAYPRGPFEWSSLIGIENVYETLLAMYTDTGDERYKICPMLKTEYLKSLI